MAIDQNLKTIAKKLTKLGQEAYQLAQNSSIPKPKGIPPGSRHHKSSLVCYIAYEEGHLLRAIIAHTTIVLIIASMVFMLVQFIRKKHHFPIRERAPKLAILQGCIFIIGVVIPYVVDILVVTTDVWENDKPDDVDFSRKFVKALFICCRINMYMVFILR